MVTVVDVIIVAWNSAPDLDTCLPSLPPGARAIVVDNGSADDSVAVARRHGATVLELGTNTGFPHAVNVGVAATEAARVLILNPDVEVDPGCLERCLEVLDRDVTIGLVGADLRESNGRPVPWAARRDRRAIDAVVDAFRLNRLHPRLDRQPIWGRADDRDVDAVQGAFMLLRTEVLRELGGLDESVFMYLEDVDLCRRVRDAGYRVRFVAGARAVHAGGTSTERAGTRDRTFVYQHAVDADVEYLRRYRSEGAAQVAIASWALRCVLGLLTARLRRKPAAQYRDTLRFVLSQRNQRVPAPRPDGAGPRAPDDQPRSRPG